MVEHTDITLWRHDFRTKEHQILTASKTIERIRRQKCYAELDELAESLSTLFDEIRAMSDEVFIELKRLTKEE